MVWYDTNVSCRRCNRSFLVRNMEQSKTSFGLLSICALLLCNSGRVPKPIPVCFMVAIAQGFFCQTCYGLPNKAKKKYYMIGKINMETLILVGRFSGFLGTFDFGIIFFASKRTYVVNVTLKGPQMSSRERDNQKICFKTQNWFGRAPKKL